MQEGELLFYFSSAIKSEKLDEPVKVLPYLMKFVDFVIEEEHRMLLLEIKDPSCNPKGSDPNAQAAMERRRKAFLEELRKDELISQALTPKARSSYAYLHLMGRDQKKMLFVFLLGAERLDIEAGLLMAFKDRLLGKIRKETDTAWVKQYVADCLVLTEAQWPRMFPQYPLKRIPR